MPERKAKSTYNPHRPGDVAKMLRRIGVDRVDELFTDIPEANRFPKLDLPPAVSQQEIVELMRGYERESASTDGVYLFLGAGAYNHFRPAAIDALVSRGEFLTGYTPYQPNQSQGILQALFEFQSMIRELYGLDVANASLYDGSTALAEAVLMAVRKTGRDNIVVASSVHPEYRETLDTYIRALHLPVRTVAFDEKTGQINMDRLRKEVDSETACIAIGQPNFFGVVENVGEVVQMAHQNGALLITSSNPIPMAVMEPPGAQGADIVVGEGQSLGSPLMFGGPYLGLMATKTEFLRSMPGRIVGEATDRDGQRAFVMVLRAREQDIRRDKATSNICTSEVLMALRAGIYMTLMGKSGMQDAARLSFHRAHYAFDQLTALDGVEPVFSGPFFHEFALRVPGNVGELNRHLFNQSRIVGPYRLERDYKALQNSGLFCVTEMNDKGQIDALTSSVSDFTAHGSNHTSE